MFLPWQGLDDGAFFPNRSRRELPSLPARPVLAGCRWGSPFVGAGDFVTKDVIAVRAFVGGPAPGYQLGVRMAGDGALQRLGNTCSLVRNRHAELKRAAKKLWARVAPQVRDVPVAPNVRLPMLGLRPEVEAHWQEYYVEAFEREVVPYLAAQRAVGINSGADVLAHALADSWYGLRGLGNHDPVCLLCRHRGCHHSWGAGGL